MADLASFRQLSGAGHDVHDPSPALRSRRRSPVSGAAVGSLNPTSGVNIPGPAGSWSCSGPGLVALPAMELARRRPAAADGPQLLGRARRPAEVLDRLLDAGPSGRPRRATPAGGTSWSSTGPDRDGAVLGGHHDERTGGPGPDAGRACRGPRWWWPSSSTPTPTVARYAEPDKSTRASGLGRSRATGPCPTGSSTAASPLMTLLLGAVDAGLGACFLGNFRGEEALANALGVPDRPSLRGGRPARRARRRRPAVAAHSSGELGGPRRSSTGAAGEGPEVSPSARQPPARAARVFLNFGFSSRRRVEACAWRTIRARREGSMKLRPMAFWSSAVG